MSLSHLLSELANHPGAILAWEVDQPRDVTLSLFRVEGGTQQLAHTLVAPADRAAIAAELDKLGHRQGSYASMTGLVWRSADGAFTIWGPRGRVFHSDGSSLQLARQTVAFDPSMEVVAFLDDDLVDRGVRLEGSAGDLVVAKHRQTRAVSDFSYGALDALADCGWTIYLGRELAGFLGVPLVDRTSAA